MFWGALAAFIDIYIGHVLYLSTYPFFFWVIVDKRAWKEATQLFHP